jgi:hypothetical protein
MKLLLLGGVLILIVKLSIGLEGILGVPIGENLVSLEFRCIKIIWLLNRIALGGYLLLMEMIVILTFNRMEVILN